MIKVWLKRNVSVIVQSLTEETDFSRFSIQNRARLEGRKLPKTYVIYTIFSSIACTNVRNLSMSFGCIFNGSGVETTEKGSISYENLHI